MSEPSNRSAPYVLSPGEACGPARAVGGRIRLLAGSQQTGDAVTVFEAELDKGGPPLHVHDVHDESLLVLSGTLLVRVGDETHELGPGAFVWLPKGVPHAFANPSDEPAHVISVSAPSGVETFLTDQFDYFAGLGGNPPEPAKVAAIAEKHSGRLIAPPILEAP
jgi:quercetin dioxygenase-like cupin family protein